MGESYQLYTLINDYFGWVISIGGAATIGAITYIEYKKHQAFLKKQESELEKKISSEEL